MIVAPFALIAPVALLVAMLLMQAVEMLLGPDPRTGASRQPWLPADELTEPPQASEPVGAR